MRYPVFLTFNEYFHLYISLGKVTVKIKTKSAEFKRAITKIATLLVEWILKFCNIIKCNLEIIFSLHNTEIIILSVKNKFSNYETEETMKTKRISTCFLALYFLMDIILKFDYKILYKAN